MLYIGTSTQFQLHVVNRNALEQSGGTNRVDATITNLAPLPRKNDEMPMNPIVGNNGNKQIIVTKNK